jgi:hypothetical protein
MKQTDNEKKRRKLEKLEEYAREHKETSARLKLGRSCALCGYNDYASVLEFHHVEPEFKEKNVSLYRKYEDALAEALKCSLLCCRCHKEVHLGFREVTAEHYYKP